MHVPFSHLSSKSGDVGEEKECWTRSSGPGLGRCLASPLFFPFLKGSTYSERSTSQALESASPLALPLLTVSFDFLGPGPQFPHL